MPATTRDYKEWPLTWEKGLVTEVEDSVLDLGQAAALLNWEPTAQGGLRARNRWSRISTLGLPAAYKVRGISTIASASSNPRIVQVTATPNTDTLGSGVGVLSRTLNGVTPGNLLVAVAMVENSGPPTMDTAGWTSISTGNNGTNAWKKLSAGGTETVQVSDGNPRLMQLTLYELAEVDSDPVIHHSSDEPTYNMSATPEQAGGIALLGYCKDDNLGTPPNAKTTPGGWTRDNRHNFTTGARSYMFSKEYTSGAAVTDTWNHGINGQAGTALLMLFDLVATGAVTFYIVIAIATATGYSLYRMPRDDIETGTWELIDSGTSTETNSFVTMSQATGKLIWSATGMTQPREVTLVTLAAADITDLAAKAGRCSVYHKDRMFVGGSSELPSRLYFSQIGDPNTFVTATDYLDIGGDDGEAIQDLLSVEGLLLVCKTNRLYLISGSGVESFFVNELPGGSSAAGRAAVRTPYGTIVAGDTDIWVVQGGAVDPMSRPLGAEYILSGRATTAYAQDSALIADSDTGTVYRANLVSGAWMLEEVDDANDAVGHLFSLQGRLYYGVMDSTDSVGGTRRLSSDRTYDYVGGTDFNASTGKMSLLGPSYRYTPRFLFFQVRSHDATKTNILHVQIQTDQGDDEHHSITVTEEVIRDRIDLGKYKGCEWIQVHVYTNSSSIAPALDVEKSVLGVLTEPYR